MKIRDIIIESKTVKVEPQKPRNFVAKNAMATTSGAGAHRDKKKEQKQGYEKHKGQGVSEDTAEGLEEGWKEKMAAAALAGSMAFGASAGQKVNPETDQIISKSAATQQADDPFTVGGKQMPKDLRRALMKMPDKDGERAYAAWRMMSDKNASKLDRINAEKILRQLEKKHADLISGETPTASTKPATTQQANDPFTIDGKQMPKNLRSMLSKMSDKDGEQAYMAWRALVSDASSNQSRMMAGQLLTKITDKYQKKSVAEGWGQREFEVNGYVYMTEIDEEEDNRKIFHMIKTPDGKTVDVDFTPYQYMSRNDVELYVKLGMPKRQGVGPLDSEKLQKMAQIKGVAMLDPKMARAGMEDQVQEEPASRALCTSGKPDSALGASQLASCKSQGYRSRDGGKSHKVGSDRVKVRGKKIKGKKYGGPLPDWS